MSKPCVSGRSAKTTATNTLKHQAADNKAVVPNANPKHDYSGPGTTPGGFAPKPDQDGLKSEE